jgi:hypothetical protein
MSDRCVEEVLVYRVGSARDDPRDDPRGDPATWRPGEPAIWRRNWQ